MALARSLDARVIETHISWVLLTADTALKIKKPVKLPFVDYSTLAARHRFCEEELRLNRRLAPHLYVDLARIAGDTRAPRLDGKGPVIDYAVRMRRFAEGALFSERLARGELQAADVDALAALLARFHDEAPAARNGSDFGSPVRRRDSALAALKGAAAALGPQRREHLAHWLRDEALRLEPAWIARRAQGRIRECHGDLHLNNVVMLDQAVAAFDGIEFDAALRWIDVADDLAFPVMDLQAHGRGDLAMRLVNAWLDATGDHDALIVLRYGLVYRALVRSQVESLQHGPDSPQARAYADAAMRWMEPAEPALTIMHGLPGSGKTWQSQRLLEAQGAIRIRSDVERKRLFGLPMLAASRDAGLDIYGPEATRHTYERLFALARAVLHAGWPVILDAAFLRRDERDRAHALARECGARFAIASCSAPVRVLRERLRARTHDASEADTQVLDVLRAGAEPIAPQERAFVFKPAAN